MNLHDTAVRLLDATAFVYLASCLAYIVSIARTGRGIRTWALIASILALVGFAMHTTGLGMRWYIGGIGRPPWTNLYESLIAFGWGVVAFQIWAQFKWKLPIVGVVSMPLALILMGMSVMTSNKLVEPLIPALQSNWLKIHVFFGILAYAGFTLSACFAFLHLMKNRASFSRIGAGLALMTLLNLGMAGGWEAFYTGDFTMAKTVVRQLPGGGEVRVKDTYREVEDGPVITRMEQVPHAALPFWISFGLFAAAAGVMWAVRHPRAKGETGGFDLGPVGRGLFAGGVVALFALFASIGMGLKASPTLTLQSNPYLTMLLFITAFFCVVYLLISVRRDRFLEALPSAERLDELGYKLILFGFPFQTLLLVTGAIWAYSAWGRSWAWDPKETWAFITWVAYLIYLHGKLLLRWKPNFLSVVSIVGFVIMIFAFLGVNLLLSGLHAYGSA
jgi:ABC-type transport system involved in cytochrome c biogenesis permease subunit